MRMIVEYPDDMHPNDALEYVQKVILGGRVSNHGKQYCYHTVFADETSVSTWLNKRSDRFLVYKRKGQG